MSMYRETTPAKWSGWDYRNWHRLTPYQQIILFVGIGFDPMIYLSVKPRSSIKNVNFRNKKRLKVS